MSTTDPPERTRSASLELARRLTESVVLFAALFFFSGFFYNYYYLQMFGLPVSFATFPWQYTIVYGYPVIAHCWIAILLLFVVLVAAIEYGDVFLAGKVKHVQSLRYVGSIALVALAIAVAISIVHRAAYETASDQVIEICEGRVPAFARIGLTPEGYRAIRQLYPRDFAKLDASMAFVSVGALEIPNAHERAALVSEDQDEYDVLLVPARSRTSCADMTLFRIPKKDVAFERSFVVAP